MPSIGNNDVEMHYQHPAIDKKEAYYADLYAIWFTEVQANHGFKDTVKDTFMEGGYYAVDLTESVKLISLNSIMFSLRNKLHDGQAAQ